jgi:hypothetical protein
MAGMAAQRTKEPNKRLRKLRGDMSQTEFGDKYFGVPFRTYARYESSKDADLPGPVLMLIRLYERNGLTIRDAQAK